MVWLKSSHFTGNYLGGVRLHLTGCGGEDRTQLRLICRHGNALVHTTLGPQLRYIVVRLSGPLSCSQWFFNFLCTSAERPLPEHREMRLYTYAG